jgi:predicted dehydrogenase
MSIGKFKIGIIGCGAVAYRWYLKGLSQKNDSYILDAICDIDGKKAEKVAKDFNIAKWCKDFKSLLNFNLDLVVILTRHDAHYEHIKFFLDNDVNVYSEKPFAPNTRLGQKLLSLANAKKLVMGSADSCLNCSSFILVVKLNSRWDVEL